MIIAISLIMIESFLKTLATNQLLVENRTTIFDTVIFNSSLNNKEEQDHRKNTVSQCH